MLTVIVLSTTMSSKQVSTTPFLLLFFHFTIFLTLCFKSNATNQHISMVTGRTDNNSSEGQIAIYWGRDKRENTLIETCSTGNYNIVIISFLSRFGQGLIPEVQLGGHCTPSTGGCLKLTPQIKACQALGVKIFLSVGGPPGGYSISNSTEANDISNYLWNVFLGGSASSRPFGSAILDGIDFDIRGGNDTSYNEISSILSKYSTSSKKIYLSVSTPCLYPPRRLSSTLKTGLIDYVWVQFYNVYASQEECEYNPDNENSYKEAWKWWSEQPVHKVFFGALASFDAGLSGYILPDVFISKVLPFVKQTEKYGGVMIWNKLEDDKTEFASAIKSAV